MKFKVSILNFLMLAALSFVPLHIAYSQTASILPPAKTTYLDKNGKPLAFGTVDFYIPGTTTPKMTWQDAGQTIPNTNPVVLDNAGRSIVLGDGSYRQIVRDKNGNLIWDQVTSSTGSGSGGGGTPTIGDGDPVGIVKVWTGFITPYQYAFAYGQEFARASYPELYQAITIQLTVNCTIGSSTLSGISDTSQLSIGSPIESSCLNSGATIVSKTLSTVVASSNAIISTTTTARFFPYGNGDGSSTFNLPDYRGRVIAGRDNMGGIASTRLTAPYFGVDPSATGASGGFQSKVLTTSELPNSSPVFTGTPATINVTTARSDLVFGTVAAASDGSGGPIGVLTAASRENNSATSSGSYTPSGSIAALGSGEALSLIQPTQTANYIIKILPDTNPNSYFGVASIGGMYGVIVCGDGLTCSGNTISLNAPTGGTVTSVDTGNCLTGGPITASGVLNFSSSCIIPLPLYIPTPSGVDDTAQFNTAIAACSSMGGCLMTCPAGVTYIVSQISLPNNTTLSGKCTIKQKTSGTPTIVISNKSQVTVDGITVFGTLLDNYLTNGCGSPTPPCSNQTAVISGDIGIRVFQSNQVRIQNVQVTEFGYRAIEIQSSSKTWVQNSYLYSNAIGIMYIGGNTWMNVSGNTVDHTSLYSLTPTTDQFSVAIGIDTTSSVAYANNFYGTVENNTITNHPYAQAVLIHAGQFIVINGNIANNVSQCISVGTFSGASLTNQHITVNNNVCFGSQASTIPTESDVGIGISSGPGLDPILYVTVSNNTVSNFNSAYKGANDGGIIINHAENVIVSGNVLRANYANGIVISENVVNIVVNNNNINSVIAAGGNQNGIYAQFSPSGIMSSNLIYGAQYGVRILGSTSNIKYSGLQQCLSVTTCYSP